MEVICNGYKYCIERTKCAHAIPHEIITGSVGNCLEVCLGHICDIKTLRKQKLEKIENRHDTLL